MALVILPLVLVPLALMASVGYVRARAIVKGQADQQLLSTISQQVAVIDEWVSSREQRLQIGSQRSTLLESVAQMLDNPAATPAFQDAQGKTRAELEELRSRQGVVLFSDLLIIRNSDGRILTSTRPEWEGRSVKPLAQKILLEESMGTFPIFEEPVLAPGEVAMLSYAPLHMPESASTELLLIGVNSDLRLGVIMEEIQTLWERRGVYRVERGSTYIAFPPNNLIRLGHYSMTPETLVEVDYPVFELAPSNPSGTVEYVSLNGEPVLGAYEWLAQWNMGIVTELPAADVFVELNSLTPFTALLFAAATFLTVGLVILATNQLLRPLGNLTEFAGRISRGEWLYRVPENRDDELGALAAAFNRMADDLSGLYRTLEERVEERTKQIRTAAEVARAITSSPSLEDILNRAVQLIHDRFGHYHVSIFLLDETRRNAVLRASTGEVGAALIARKHQLEVGSASIIGWVTANKQPRIATDVSLDPVHLKNELLPETRSEAAIPLVVGGQVLGALDVQSTSLEAFQPESMEVLQTLADQLSAALQNARLAETSANAADRARLIREITGRLSGAMGMEQVLQTTARSLHQALGRPEITVKLVKTDGDRGRTAGAVSSESEGQSQATPTDPSVSPSPGQAQPEA